MNIYAKAADILMEKGHCKGTLEDENGAHCAIGALRAAARWGETGEWRRQLDYGMAQLKAEQRLGDNVPGDEALAPLARWNDAPDTTAEDVILLFKELAQEEES